LPINFCPRTAVQRLRSDCHNCLLVNASRTRWVISKRA
jgi:hypothetical protein